jgi:hypothetical protein
VSPPGEGAGNCAVGAVGTRSRVSPLWTLQCPRLRTGPDVAAALLTAERTVTRAGNIQVLTAEPRLKRFPIE